MKRFGLLALAGTVIFGVALVGFSLISASALAPFRYLVLLIYIVASLGLFWHAARFLSVASLIGLGCAIAVGSTSFYQILGFGFFRGLVKDLDPFEWPHLQSLALIFLLLLCWHLIVVLLMRMTARRYLPS